VATVTDRLGIITEYSYNTYGRLTAITRAKGTPVEMTTEMVYDPVTHELK
jgi:YD repeat-containing protein